MKKLFILLLLTGASTVLGMNNQPTLDQQLHALVERKQTLLNQQPPQAAINQFVADCIAFEQKALGQNRQDLASYALRYINHVTENHDNLNPPHGDLNSRRQLFQ